MEINKDMGESISKLLDAYNEMYWKPLYKYLEKNPALISTFPAFLLTSNQIMVYFGKTHLAIEYIGAEKTEKLPKERKLDIKWHDYTQSEGDFFELIIGFEFDGPTNGFKLPLPMLSEDLVLPTNSGFDKLLDLKWNFEAQSALFGFNTGGFAIPEQQFCRIVNGLFFDADDNGLKTRHIKWIDFIPVKYDDKSNAQYDDLLVDFNPLLKIIEFDAKYKYPLPPKSDFKFSKLPKLNRFIELLANHEASELEITKFLNETDNKFILTMGFLANKIIPQIKCIWQSETKDPIIPDFLLEKPNGYCDIVEFKLPSLRGKSSVGKPNRETFSSEINSYISQTRCYREYFDDPNNRKWIEDKHGLKVHYPKRILVIGRRWDFTNTEWKSIINDYKDLEIMTYDDIVDGVMAQFYI